MNIYQYFENSFLRFPNRPALHVDGDQYSYSALSAFSDKIAASIPQDSNPFVGLFGHRSLTAYTGVLGILKVGKAYVPLNHKFPVARSLQIINLSGINTIVVGRECLSDLDRMMDGFPRQLTLIFPDLTIDQVPSQLSVQHNCVFPSRLDPSGAHINSVSTDDFAYMLFTSGSTGVPKGVPISHGNVMAYVDYMRARYEVNELDRFSQTFDLTFDLSVHDLFLSWGAGATLYSIPENEVMMPAKFIKKHELTMWFSVPSLGQFMNRFKLLKPGAFPSLRFSLFCGEPLPLSIALKWQQAAPNSVLENIYGPTEATIGITHYRMPNDTNEIKSYNGIVSIGHIFETQQYCILNETLMPVPLNAEGELCLGGSQLSAGYWRNEDKTHEQFIPVSAMEGQVFYKTGDIVKMDEDSDIFFISRKDFQVKIRGYRVELGEINHAISTFLGSAMVASIPFPFNDGMAENIYSFVEKQFTDRKVEILRALVSTLPDYMVPTDILFLDRFPMNANGKVDQKALTGILDEKLRGMKE